MTRSLPLALPLLALACGQPQPAKVDCTALTGEPADRCWAERALDPQRDPQQHHAAALRIEDEALRDLALAQAAQGQGVDACDPIRDMVLRKSCQTRNRRPHLDIPEPPEHSAGRAPSALPPHGEPEAQAAARAQQHCDPQPEGVRDLCLQQRAGAEPVALGWYVCTGIRDPDLRGDCFAQAATLLGQADQPELATGVCAAIDDPRWRGECQFRLSEALPLTRVDVAAQACLGALGFEDECLKHLIQRQAQASALRARFGSASETMAGMAQDLEGLRGAIDPRPEEAWLRRLYWYEAFHALLAEALQGGRLAAVAPQGDTVLDGDPRQEPWRDCATKLCAYTLAQQPGVPDLDALRQGIGRCAYGPGGDEPTPTLLAPTAPASRFGELATSEVPAPIQPGAGCDLDPPTRATIAALWGLEQLAWDHSRALVDQALAHPEPTVRAYTLDMAEHKAFFWQRQDRDGQRWLTGRLATVAQGDPSAPIRQRATVLVEALEAGERPGRWAFQASGVCGGS
jgi:hypothetical protein